MPTAPASNLKLGLKKHIALDLFRAYRAVQARLHQLTYLFWECTLRCNIDCIHCGSDCQKESSVPDMPLADFLRVADEVKEHADPGKVMVALSGGEPSMRPDLPACGAALAKRGFPWGMVTNGYNVSKDRFHELLDSGLRSITISLDGLEQSHDWLRGTSGSFKRAKRAVELAARVPNLTFDVVTCVTKRNIQELDAIKKLLIELGVKKWRLFTIFPKGRALGHPDLIVNANRLRRTLEFIKSCRQEGKIETSCGCEGFLGSYEGEVSDSFFWCRAGINIGSVLADGSISACPSLRNDYIQGNIYQDSFMDVWNNRFQIMRKRKWAKTGICEKCAYFKWCSGNGLHLRDETSGELLECHLGALEC